MSIRLQLLHTDYSVNYSYKKRCINELFIYELSEEASVDLDRRFDHQFSSFYLFWHRTTSKHEALGVHHRESKI